MIFEWQRALDIIDLHVVPYDTNYVNGLYSDYTYSDDDFSFQAKGDGEKSSGRSSGNSVVSGSGYAIDSDSDFIIEFETPSGDDNIYSVADGEIGDTPQQPTRVQCMMASHGNASGGRFDGGQSGQTTSG
jgi:hypothetical protein